MKQKIENLLQLAIKKLQEKDKLPAIPAFIQINAAKGKHGDYASNVAFILAKLARMQPLKVAELIVNALPSVPFIEKIEIASPGFINLFLSSKALQDVITTVLQQKEAYGRSKIGREKKILIEFVSANPTGALHVGHGRHAAFGDVTANLLDAVGFKVFREFYINDDSHRVNNNILSDIREDLAEFGVHFDNWYSEHDHIASEKVRNLVNKLNANGHVYERNGDLFFRATDFGDDKDRQLNKSNGPFTYFANDIAYHMNKFDRGFDIAIDIFGGEYYKYVSGMKAAIQTLGINSERLQAVFMQFVSLYRGKKIVSQSTRGGEFVTLRELREEVGNDATRFFYLMRKSEQPINFDLDLAKSKSNENPVYYIQYAYARICSVFKQLHERQFSYDEKNGLAHLDLLTEREERQLQNTLSRYPDMIIHASLQYEPHVLANFLRELATDFHSFYNAHQIIVANQDLRDARLVLISAVQQTLLNGFKILGISAKETM